MKIFNIIDKFFDYYQKNNSWCPLYMIFHDGNINPDYIINLKDYKAVKLGKILLKLKKNQRKILIGKLSSKK